MTDHAPKVFNVVAWGCSRQAAEYVYFSLAMAVCLGIIFAVLTNFQFAASAFTLVLLILTVLYSFAAVVFFIVATVGNDG
jgi:ABC-type sugar transport system permease subunit